MQYCIGTTSSKRMHRPDDDWCCHLANSMKNKKSSGDEIENVNCFYDDIAQTLQNTKKANLLRLTN